MMTRVKYKDFIDTLYDMKPYELNRLYDSVSSAEKGIISKFRRGVFNKPRTSAETRCAELNRVTGSAKGVAAQFTNTINRMNGLVNVSQADKLAMRLATQEINQAIEALLLMAKRVKEIQDDAIEVNKERRERNKNLTLNLTLN